MPNQVNYPDPIPVPYIEYRPERLSEEERALVQTNVNQIVFGTSRRDYAELWVYDSNGGIAGHVNLNVTDPAISLSTIVSNTGAYELLNIDMTQAVQTMLVESGRYGFTANFFRDEVGSEYLDDNGSTINGRRLYVSDISDDRTELLLVPKGITERTDPLLDEIYNWVLPSVPPLYAQGLLDQTFGKSLPTDDGAEVPLSEQLTSDKIMVALNDTANVTPSVQERVSNADAQTAYNEMMAKMIPLIGSASIEFMNSALMNKVDPNIQESELYNFIHSATAKVISDFNNNGWIDPRFNVHT